jgi:hypothetical protein
MQQVKSSSQDKFMIKIGCTTTKNFNYKCNSIDKKSINHMVFGDLVSHYNNCGINFIDSSNVTLLYKTFKEWNYDKYSYFTTKTLEFGCSREINELDLSKFITTLKSFGFCSDLTATVNFCGYFHTRKVPTFEVLFARDFSTNTDVKIDKRQRHKNKSQYATVILN